MLKWDAVVFFVSRLVGNRVAQKGGQFILAIALLLSLFASAVNIQPARGATTLSVTPITWNIIGLDSNLVTVGPNHFPIGVRVCNTGASVASGVTATMIWDSANTYIDFRPGTDSALSVASLAVGACADFYFEVEVDRDPAAYDTTRGYHIEVTADAGATTGSTPTPRELYVEHLISQSRNATTDVQLSTDGSSYSSVAPGGTMTLMVGQTYWIKLVGKTATNGYEQIETFINLPNTIFQVLSVDSTYTAESSGNMSPPYDRLYGDGCVWENNPNSLNYRSCLDVGKAGGDITVTYQVKILSVPSSPLTNPEALQSLIYDFSGSSYHYNADFGGTIRYVKIVNPTITKSFAPKSINPNGTSTLTFTITNPGPTSISSVNFTDNPLSVPSGVSVASTTVTYSGCGGSESPSSLTVGATSLSFSNITVAASSVCTITLTVTASSANIYVDTTQNLFVGTVDTGSYGTDTLVVTSKPAPPSSCVTYSTLATWTMPTSGQGSGGPPPPYTTRAADVATADASAGLTGAGSQFIELRGNPTANSWGIRDAWLSTAGTPNPNTAPYFQFLVDTSNYGAVRIQLDHELYPNGEWAAQNDYYLYSSTDGATFTQIASVTGISKSWTTEGPTAAATTGVSQTWFRIIFVGRKDPQEATSKADLDNVIIEGCQNDPPTLTKSFTPSTIIQGNNSVLRFTFTNPNSFVSRTGVGFSDTLPTGLLVATPNGLTGVTCATGSISGQTITATAGGSTITMSGATLSAGANCYFEVNILGDVAGDYTNTSGSITSTETGPNTTPPPSAYSGYGVSSLNVVDPPSIEKSFGADTVFTGDTTSLTFTVTNPNLHSMSSVAFSDTLPSGVNVSNSSTSQCGGTLTTTDSNPDTVVLSGGSLAANESCTFSVTVTGSTLGTKNNTTGAVTGTVLSTAVTGNTASDSLIVEDRAADISLLKQVGASATGPWYTSATIPTGSNVYYRFLVENTGDLALTSTNVTDPTVSGEETCAFTDPLPVAVVANDNHIDDCVVGPVTASAGSHPNTAQAHGTYSSTVYDSNFDTATYQNFNFGHLPSAYLNMNLVNDGGAYHLNGSTFFGASIDDNDSDGINTATYTPKASDDGVTYTPGVDWTVGANGGSVRLTIACPSSPCYVNAWIDWNRDNDFNDTDEQIFTDLSVSTGTFDYTFDIPAGTTFDGSTFYSRFRIYDQNPTNDQPNGQAMNGSTALYGEIEDPFFTVSSGGVVTPVTVSYFKAVRQGSGVQFEWSTSTETGNVGFNLYVENGRRLTRLNTELIPSQAVDSLERLDYSFFADASGNTFYIEDVSVAGETRRHGPFQVGKEYGEQVEQNLIDWASVQRQAVGGKPLGVGASVIDVDSSGLLLKVRQTGIHRLTYEMLRDAGFDLAGYAPTEVALTNNGRAVPITVKAQGSFGPGAYIEFYGQALDTLYTDTNVYMLKVTNAPAARIWVNNAKPPVGAKIPASYAAKLTVNNQRSFAEYAPGDDPWYDTSMLAFTSSKSWDFLFHVDGLVKTAGGTLNLTVWGVTNWPQNPDHHLVVSVNGVPVASEIFDGTTLKTLQITLPAGTLHEGDNVLQLTLPGDTGVDWDMVNLDKFTVTYRRVFRAQDGQLTFTAAGQAFKVTNLPSRDVVVYRKNKNGLARLGQVQVQAMANGTFNAIFAGTTDASTYMVYASNALYAPAFEAPRPQADLNRPAEYLIIAHPSFIAGLQPLVQARQAQGLTVNVVDVNDLYARYTYGVFNPQAIKKYIAYAAQNLGTRYVLLVGGDTYDYRNYLGVNSVSFIPSLYVSTGPTVRYVPADPLYADVNNDRIPDLAIGRFPVRTQAELTLMVNKTLAYQGKDYRRTAVFASDKSDGFTSFKNISNSLSTGLPSGWTVESIHLDDLSVTAARTQLLAAMNRGTALVTFTGHSGPVEWTFSQLFNTKYAAGLTNAGRPFVAVQWGCWNNYYVHPTKNYLVQSLLFSGDKGAVATLGASTLTDSESEWLLGDRLMPRLTTRGMTLGQALQEAKADLARTHPELLDVILGWSLMGDPALVVEP